METTDTRVLYHDSGFAVVNKMVGEICESDGNDAVSGILRNALENKFGRKLPYIHAVHRIDRPVSGCLLLAYDRNTAAFFNEEFSAGRVTKRYDAIVEKPVNGLPAETGRLEHGLLFDRRRQKAILCSSERMAKGYKKALLAWELAGYTENYACIRVYPETGRTHQIRAQLAAAGMPIKGDLKYGAKRSERGGGIRLHARRIQFTHPVTGNRMTITAPVIDADALWLAFPGDDQ